MKKSKLITVVFLIPLLFSLQACTGKSVMLQNSAGDEVKCEVSTTSAMLTGAAVRDSKMRNCIHDYELQGYIKKEPAG